MTVAPSEIEVIGMIKSSMWSCGLQESEIIIVARAQQHIYMSNDVIILLV